MQVLNFHFVSGIDPLVLVGALNRVVLHPYAAPVLGRNFKTVENPLDNVVAHFFLGAPSPGEQADLYILVIAMRGHQVNNLLHVGHNASGLFVQPPAVTQVVDYRVLDVDEDFCHASNIANAGSTGNYS